MFTTAEEIGMPAVTALTGLNEKSIRAARRKNKFPHPVRKVKERNYWRYLWHRADVEQWLREREHGRWSTEATANA